MPAPSCSASSSTSTSRTSSPRCSRSPASSASRPPPPDGAVAAPGFSRSSGLVVAPAHADRRRQPCRLDRHACRRERGTLALRHPDVRRDLELAPPSSSAAANETVSRPGASQNTTVPQARQRPRLAPCSETAARSQIECRLVADGEIAPVARPMRATARRSPPGTPSQWQTITSRTGPSIAKRTAPQGQAPWPRHAGSAGEQAIEIAVRRPPAARDADQAGCRDLADVHAGVVERLDELGRLAGGRGRRRASSARPRPGSTTSTRVGEQLAAALGDARRHGRRPTTGGCRAPRAGPRATTRGHQPGSKRAAPGFGSNCPSGSYSACEK